jgi:hypothetical protein
MTWKDRLKPTRSVLRRRYTDIACVSTGFQQSHLGWRLGVGFTMASVSSSGHLRIISELKLCCQSTPLPSGRRLEPQRPSSFTERIPSLREMLSEVALRGIGNFTAGS